MMDRRKDGRETWHRLLEWDKGQSPSERLAATVLSADGYTNVDPSHPLGGKDGKKDGVVRKDGVDLILAVYFPRGKKTFSDIKNKFSEDLEGVTSCAQGIVFVTNQEIKLSERAALQKIGEEKIVDLYHLERLATLLNVPENYGIRLEFLDIAMTNEEIISLYTMRDKRHLAQLKKVSDRLEKTTKQLIGYSIGGNSIPIIDIYPTLYDKNSIDISVRVLGEFPLYDVSVKIPDFNEKREELIQFPDGRLDIENFKQNKKKVNMFTVGNLTPNHSTKIICLPIPDQLPKAIYTWSFARNGVFLQEMLLGLDTDNYVENMSIKVTNVTRMNNSQGGEVVYKWEK